MQIAPINNFSVNKNNGLKKGIQNNSNRTFTGRTNFYAFTDIHQNAENHCKMIYELIKNNNNKQNVLLDNGDIFKGLFPKFTMMMTYARAKMRTPELEIVYNLGNNDPGFMELDRMLFKKYLNVLQRYGVKTISCNVVDEKTGLRPDGVKPYTIIERDGDKLLYVGFVVNKLKQEISGMTTIDPMKALENIAPELKNVMKEKECKGLVMMVHDEEKVAKALSARAKELGLNPDFVIGGHVHHKYLDEQEKIIYPEPFGKSMLSFSLDINSDSHKLSDIKEISSDDCELGIYEKLIQGAKERENYNQKIAKSVTELNFKYQDEFRMEFSQLGTMYADGIKAISNSKIGFVPKSWMYDTLPKKDGYITKLDILLSCPQPYRHIVQLKMTPDELKRFYQYDIDKKSRLFDASQNFGVVLDKNNQIKQININGKGLFDSNGKAKDPKRIITIAIDGHTAGHLDCEQNELDLKMYDGVVHGLKQLEKVGDKDFVYPTAKLEYV